jgi:hypothetical protein
MNIPHSRGQWVRVSTKDPCPVCKRGGWCAVTADGTVAKCMRIEAGSYRSGQDPSGRYWLHRLDGTTRPDPPSGPHDGPVAERAAPDTLHAVYDAMLAGLPLSQAHRDGLRKRGLTDSEIDRRLYRTLPSDARARVRLAGELAERWPDAVLSVPGIVCRESGGRRYLSIAGKGLLVPVRDPAGHIVAAKIRRDDPLPPDVQRYYYLSSVKSGGPGPGAPPHVPLGTTGPCPCVRLTEGELKADVAYLLSGLPTISAPGVSHWRTCLPVLRQLGTQSVVLAFDNDAATNPIVGRALSECWDGLSAEKYDVLLERWGTEHKGIDDALAAGAAVSTLAGDKALDAVAETVAAATAGDEPAPPDPLDRLPDLLRDGGAEALFRERELLQALARLSIENPAEWACVRTRLRSADVRLRDLEAALAPLRQAVRAKRPLPDAAGEYRISGGRIVHTRQTQAGPVDVPLSNFAARIVSLTTHDDGVERAIHLAIEGELADGTPLPRVEIAAADFARMEWTIPAWGTRAVVCAGRGTADHLRAALQLLSGDVPHRVVFGHLGWRELGGRWLYLHSGGAIGADGPVAGVETAPPEALARYVLPAPPTGEQLRRAVRASLALLHLAPGRVA